MKSKKQINKPEPQQVKEKVAVVDKKSIQLSPKMHPILDHPFVRWDENFQTV
jgi:hypothetical protein